MYRSGLVKLHDVFHVGLLKQHHGSPSDGPSSLPPVRHGCACPVPVEFIKGRSARGRLELLVHWVGQPIAEASWVDIDEFRSLHPSFKLADDLALQVGRDVMTGLHYNHRSKGQQQGEQTPKINAPNNGTRQGTGRCQQRTTQVRKIKGIGLGD
jgi:hypothetical protein